MSLSADKVGEGLLQHHFFPRIARGGDELPPCFTSADFTKTKADSLLAETPRERGYGTIAMRSARYELVPRDMEVLHPWAFANIARRLCESWDEWRNIVDNPSSAIRMTEHSDGRVFSMNPMSSVTDLMRPGGRFLAKVDIVNFYGSIYTHAIPWAVHGVERSKQLKYRRTDWANHVDKAVQTAHRMETTGIAVGPGTSAIIGEIMLRDIDERLRTRFADQRGTPSFLRFIDDYYFVGETRNDAENFVRALREELRQLKLPIHPNKTTITELPSPLAPRWVRELRLACRGNSAGQLLDLVDRALDRSEQIEEDRALNWALTVVERELGSDTIGNKDRSTVIDRLLSVGFLRPIAARSACRILSALDSAEATNRAEDLNRILEEHVRNGWTDVATWVMYTLANAGEAVSDKAAEIIIGSRDCLSMAMLMQDEAGATLVEEFVDKLEHTIRKREDSVSLKNYRRDEYWLLYYQHALAEKRFDSVPGKYYDEFQPLIEEKVSFVEMKSQKRYQPSLGDRTLGKSSSGGGGGRDPYAF